MAVDIVLAIGTSHSPSLNSPAEDYPKHAAIDASGRKLLDKQGRPTTYGALLEKSDPSIKDQIAPEVLEERSARYMDATNAAGEAFLPCRRHRFVDFTQLVLQMPKLQ